MTNARTEESMSLADGGCNGTCVNGKTWRIICFIPNRRVNITGLENHQVNGNKLCSAGQVVESFNGKKQRIIVIVHQAAYVPTSNAILSNVQMRANGCRVDDRAVEHGGEQCITTDNGYKIPMCLRNGLPYVKGRPYTDKEWIELPHVHLTSDDIWDPSKLNKDLSVEDLYHTPIQLPTPSDLQVHPDYDLEGGLLDGEVNGNVI